MKSLKTFEDFEYALKQKPVPKFEEELMISRLQAAANKRTKYSIKKIIVVAAVIMIIMIPSFVYGKNLIKQFIYSHVVISSTSLKDKEGNETLNYSLVKPDEGVLNEMDKIQSISEKYSHIMYKHKSELKEDEIEIFLVVDAYKLSGSFTLLQNYSTTSLDDIIKKASIEFKIPNTLPDKYHFKHGFINYPAIMSGIEDLYNKAVKEGKDYITKKVKKPEKPSQIILTYADHKGRNEINIEITLITGKEEHYTDDENHPSQVEIIKIKDHEVLYKTIPSLKHSINWMIFTEHNGTDNLLYTISYFNQVDKDLTPHVIKMIESMF